ncbi:uncharacterized protein LOC119688406 [Teleopsis dalmanni]|uniref:uncharacterized protein LOC119688406 n=1 Tax=Teleopsis dalmanni TaxID=139649 RepID=UPI0018CF4C14|nr:uncharacterized protein LOC119688406 [Teleopsis dalmanni]
MSDTDKNTSNQNLEENVVESGDHEELPCEPQDGVKTAEEFSTICNELTQKLTKDLSSCEALWELFISATKSYDNIKPMLPYLPKFVKNHEHLLVLIQNTPHLREMRREWIEPDECSDKLSILLVYWVLFELKMPTFETLTRQEVDKLVATLKETRTVIKPTYIFNVDYNENSEEEQLFITRSSQYPTKFCFFGCPASNLFEILIRGFKVYKHQNNSNYGIPFNNQSLLVLNDTPSTPCWGKCSFGDSFQAVALCEFIEKPEYYLARYDEHNCCQIHVQHPDMVRIRYVFFYCENAKAPTSSKKN